MIFKKVRIYILMFVFFSFSVIANEKNQTQKQEEEIKEIQALVSYEKDGIKNIMKKINELPDGSSQKVRLQSLLKRKHKELGTNIEALNELIRATSHNSRIVDQSFIKRAKTIDELEDEIGIDRTITSVKKMIDKKYKDFVKTPENKEWQQKKKDYFRIKEQSKKVILVE